MHIFAIRLFRQTHSNLFCHGVGDFKKFNNIDASSQTGTFLIIEKFIENCTNEECSQNLWVSIQTISYEY